MSLLVGTKKHLQIFKEPLQATLKSLQMMFPAHLTHVEHGKTKKINKSALLELKCWNTSFYKTLINLDTVRAPL